MKPPNLIRWIKRARGPHSQLAYSKLCGVPQGNLSYMESGVLTNPTLDTLLKIAHASEGRVGIKLSVN